MPERPATLMHTSVPEWLNVLVHVSVPEWLAMLVHSSVPEWPRYANAHAVACQNGSMLAIVHSSVPEWLAMLINSMPEWLSMLASAHLRAKMALIAIAGARDFAFREIATCTRESG